MRQFIIAVIMRPMLAIANNYLPQLKQCRSNSVPAYLFLYFFYCGLARCYIYVYESSAINLMLSQFYNAS